MPPRFNLQTYLIPAISAMLLGIVIVAGGLIGWAMLRVDGTFVEPEAGRDRLRIIGRSHPSGTRHARYIDRPGIDSDAGRYGDSIRVPDDIGHRNDADVICCRPLAVGFVESICRRGSGNQRGHCKAQK